MAGGRADRTPGLGTVEALNTASIQSQVTGVLEEVDFVEGQTVKKGDILAKIDPRLYQAALEQAQAQWRKRPPARRGAKFGARCYSKQEFKKFDRLLPSRLISSSGPRSTRCHEGDEALINTDQTNLDYTTLWVLSMA